MNSNEISQFIMDTIEDLVYVANIDTYELYYLNGVAIRSLGVQKESDWKNKKCYQILQGLDAPCAFCTNHLLKHDAFYNWEHYNPILKSHYYIQDKLICLDGRDVRLEIAKNITEIKLLEQAVTQKYEEQRVLNQCVGLLHSTRTPTESINDLLEIIANYYQAERGYIFDLDPDKKHINNTFEWCLEGVEPQLDNLQQVDVAVVDRWFEKYESVGEFYISVLDEDVVPGSAEYQILDDQGITSLVTAPLRDKNGEIMGFIGVDNPKRNIRETAVIRSIGVFVSDFFDKNELIEKLNRLSYYDNLTGLKNRHSYSLALQRIKDGTKTSLGVVYADVNGLKIINDKMGHQIGDACIVDVAHTVRAMFKGNTYRIGGDEFVALCVGIEKEAFLEKVAALEAQFSVSETEQKAAVGYIWQEDSREVIQQIEQADSSMYEAKQRYYSGRLSEKMHETNKVRIHTIKKNLKDAELLENALED